MNIINDYFDAHRESIRSTLEMSGMSSSVANDFIKLLSSSLMNTVVIVGPEKLYAALESKIFSDFINLVDVYFIARESGLSTEQVIDATQKLWPSFQSHMLGQDDDVVSVASKLFGNLSDDVLHELRRFID